MLLSLCCLYMLARGTLAQDTNNIMFIHPQCCLKMPMSATGSWAAILIYATFLDQGDAL